LISWIGQEKAMVDGKGKESLISWKSKQLQLNSISLWQMDEQKRSFPVRLVGHSLQQPDLAGSFTLRKSLLKILLNEGLVLLANAP